MRLLWLIPFIFSSPSPSFRKRYFSKEGEKETFGRFYRNEVKKEGESMKDIYIYKSRKLKRLSVRGPTYRTSIFSKSIYVSYTSLRIYSWRDNDDSRIYT